MTEFTVTLTATVQGSRSGAESLVDYAHNAEPKVTSTNETQKLEDSPVVWQ